MANKIYIFIATLVLLIFISISTKFGTNRKYLKCSIKQKETDNELYYENYNLALIKYFY